MSEIIERYSFNVPKFETSKQAHIGGQGGKKCGRNCATCPAFGNGCNGCTAIDALGCPDNHCEASACSICAVQCHRGGARLAQTIETIGGFEIDYKLTIDPLFSVDCGYYPSIHRPLKIGDADGAAAISIPWHVFYNFQTDSPVSLDLRDKFRIPDGVKLIVNSYMKDDKVLCLFEKMSNKSFLPLLKSFVGVDYWHTPCFSVFNVSNKMDQLTNFKRQFWAGDIMRDAGINTIQEVLYTDANQHKVSAGWTEAIDIIQKKGIKKISQCGQLDSGSALKSDVQFYKNLPRDATLIITGLQSRLRDATKVARCNVIFSDYLTQYDQRGNTDFIRQSNNGSY